MILLSPMLFELAVAFVGLESTSDEAPPTEKLSVQCFFFRLFLAVNFSM